MKQQNSPVTGLLGNPDHKSRLVAQWPTQADVKVVLPDMVPSQPDGQRQRNGPQWRAR